MAFVATGIGAGIGLLGGLFKSGPDMDMTGRNQALSSMNAFKNLAAKGPGEKDVSAAYDESQNMMQMYNNLASSGLYDMSKGRQLAEQQFAPQRQALAQSLQDQMANANKAARSMGRSSNDPILRARLGAEAMRSTAGLAAQQSAAAMDLGRQSTMDMINMRNNRFGIMNELSQQAFSNQNTLFSMGQNLQGMDAQAAGYESSRGGGFKGALTGMLGGAAAGLNIATGLSNLDFSKQFAADTLNNNISRRAQQDASTKLMNRTQTLQPAAPSPIPYNPEYFNPANFANPYAGQVASTAPRVGVSSLQALSDAGMYTPSATNALDFSLSKNKFMFK